MRRLYNLVGNHRNRDIAKNLYDKDKHINIKYLLELKSICGDKCCHCGCVLDWEDLVHKRRPNQVTLQRIDHTKGHWKENVVYACFSCNINRVENKELLLNKFDKNKIYNYEEIRTIIMPQDASRVAGLK